MIVVDASAVVELLLGGGVAPRLRDRTHGESVHAPFLVEVEALQALRRIAHTPNLSDDDAAIARLGLDAMPLVLYPHRPLMERIWNLRNTLTAYDASYVALAELLPAPLVTCDVRLARSSGHDAEIELFAPA
ncbi:MAG: type II toxin-antitoxin system VapC family toxin [Gaiellaceae bacterium]